jgi:biopolymer transport protein ExbD
MSDGTAEKPNTVQLFKSGELRWNEQPVSEQDLQGRMKEAVTSDPEISVVISADKEAAHGQVVHVMDLAKVAGVTKFAINVMQVGGE